MGRQSQKRWLAVVGALVALALTGRPVTAQEPQAPLQPLRLSRNIPGDSKPVVLSADDIATWSENGSRVVLLKGKVLVQHGVLTIRAQQAVAFIDLGRYTQTRILRVDLYAEGEVQVEEGSAPQQGPSGLFDVSTRGELKLKTFGRPVLQQSLSNDPLYQRAVSERAPKPPPPTPPGPPAPGGLQRTNGQGMAAPPGPGGLQQVRYQDIEAAVGAPVIQPVQGSGTPLPGPTLQAPLPGGGPSEPPRDAGGVPVPVPPVSPGQNPPQQPPRSAAPGPLGALAPGPPGSGPARIVTIRQRSMESPLQIQASPPMPSGEQAVIVTGGIILNVSNDARIGLLDIEADRLVLWTRGDSQQMFHNMTTQGETTRELEFYLAGNVEIRQQNPAKNEPLHILRAEGVYYDVNRNVAVATNANMEFSQRRIPYPITVQAEELLQTSATTFEVFRAAVASSKLPSDPGIQVYFNDASMENKRETRTSIFGRTVVSRDTGQPIEETDLFYKAHNVFLEVEDVPIFYLPYSTGRANEPLGPLQSIEMGFNNIFGFQAGVTLDMYELLGLQKIQNTTWRLNLDYLSKRGPGLGNDFNLSDVAEGPFHRDLFGIPGKYVLSFTAWGLYDNGTDNLGGGRGADDNHPLERGWVSSRFNWFNLPYGFSTQVGISPQSDHNFYEQYFKNQFDTDFNQETFLYVKQQQGNWAWDALNEDRIRNWVAETTWLPKVDGYLLGESFFNLLTYNTHASLGYGLLRPASTAPEPTPGPPPPGPITTVKTDTGRFDWWQEMSLPFYLGPVKVVPYGLVDMTYYTEDLTGDDRGRFYAGGGARASMPLTRLYPDIGSELFNVNGINHKIVFSSNYYIAHSDTAFSQLPQLDRLNDDATDQALRDITPQQPIINPTHGLYLQTNPAFNPQIFALRQLVEDRIDTLDSIQELQFDIFQRWQTKRGYPGQQHIVDWMTLDLSGTFFPNPTQSAFGGPSSEWGNLQYNYIWNIGDRTAFVSTGWIDAVNVGANEWTVGLYLNRPDRTNFFLGYREIDILDSRAVTASVTYVFSPKYAVTGSTVYDFGTSQALSNSLTFTRLGTDVQVNLGVTYNALQNNFGMTFQIIPNIIPNAGRLPGFAPGSSPLGH